MEVNTGRRNGKETLRLSFIRTVFHTKKAKGKNDLSSGIFFIDNCVVIYGQWLDDSIFHHVSGETNN